MLAALKTHLAAQGLRADLWTKAERNAVLSAIWPLLQETLAGVLVAERQRDRRENAELEARVVAKLEEAEARLMAEIARHTVQSLDDIRGELRAAFSELLRHSDRIAARYEPAAPTPRYWPGGTSGGVA